MSFYYDLKKAREIENKLISILKAGNLLASSTEEEGKFPDYDVIATELDGSNSTTFEVKYDIFSALSRNVAVELHSVVKGKFTKSGLSASKADLYAYHFPNDESFYLIKPVEIKKMVAARRYKRQVQGGDGNRSTLALFDKKEFLSLCFKLNNKTISDL